MVASSFIQSPSTCSFSDEHGHVDTTPFLDEPHPHPTTNSEIGDTRTADGLAMVAWVHFKMRLQRCALAFCCDVWTGFPFKARPFSFSSSSSPSPSQRHLRSATRQLNHLPLLIARRRLWNFTRRRLPSVTSPSSTQSCTPSRATSPWPPLCLMPLFLGARARFSCTLKHFSTFRQQCRWRTSACAC